MIQKLANVCDVVRKGRTKRYVKRDVSISDSFKKNVSQRGLGSHRLHGTTAGLIFVTTRCMRWRRRQTVITQHRERTKNTVLTDNAVCMYHRSNVQRYSVMKLAEDGKFVKHLSLKHRQR